MDDNEEINVVALSIIIVTLSCILALAIYMTSRKSDNPSSNMDAVIPPDIDARQASANADLKETLDELVEVDKETREIRSGMIASAMSQSDSLSVEISKLSKSRKRGSRKNRVRRS